MTQSSDCSHVSYACSYALRYALSYALVTRVGYALVTRVGYALVTHWLRMWLRIGYALRLRIAVTHCGLPCRSLPILALPTLPPQPRRQQTPPSKTPPPRHPPCVTPPHRPEMGPIYLTSSSSYRFFWIGTCHGPRRAHCFSL